MRKINTREFTRATRSTARQVNRQIVLNLVREHQPISRADLARRMQIGRGMVTSLINELLEEGYIYEGETVSAPRGRKPTLLHVRTGDRFVIGVDVRFSRTYLMLGDFGGRQIALETFETQFDPNRLMRELARRIERVLTSSGATRRCEGVGLVVPGMVDRRTGQVLNAPQLGWRNVAIRDGLSELTGLPVQIENAPIACALAQMWLGPRGGHEVDDFVYVTVSDGVGAGIVVNGQVVRGHDHIAGEFGHVPLTLDGPLCVCGSRGCLEMYTSNLATLARYLGRDVAEPATRDLIRQSPLTIADLVARARRDDRRALDALKESAHYLGVGLASVVNALNPARIIVGGEIAEAWDLLQPAVRSEITRRALTPAAAATSIIPEPGSEHPRLRGAVALVVAPMYAAPTLA